jgi:sterol desaturase/sphingolipid hydroxylase (fatty acid hydroxylase superfamily)
MGKRRINNERITPRVFENDIAEMLSHVHPLTPIVVYMPVIAFLIYRAVGFGEGVGPILGVFALGLLGWTLFEYLVHRFLFHWNFKTKLGEQIHFLVHGIHHDYPRDPKRLVIPPTISIPLAIGVYLLFVLFLGEITAQAAYAGFLFGYVCYDTIHYATHHFAFKNNRLGQLLKRHHLRHHYQDEYTGYGVSSPLWDYVFGTMAEPETKTVAPAAKPRPKVKV